MALTRKNPAKYMHNNRLLVLKACYPSPRFDGMRQSPIFKPMDFARLLLFFAAPLLLAPSHPPAHATLVEDIAGCRASLTLHNAEKRVVEMVWSKTGFQADISLPVGRFTATAKCSSGRNASHFFMGHFHGEISSIRAGPQGSATLLLIDQDPSAHRFRKRQPAIIHSQVDTPRLLSRFQDPVNASNVTFRSTFYLGDESMGLQSGE